MDNQGCVQFLQWCLPRLHYQWKGFRKVRNQVCKRLNQRMSDLDLSGFSAYRDYLRYNDEEWNTLDSLCYITISRFYRDKKIYDCLQTDILPFLAETALKNGKTALRCWSAGCCSGEEPYTLKIVWELCIKPKLQVDLPLHIIATDKYPHLLTRAKNALYPESSLKELSEDLRNQAFSKKENGYRLKYFFRKDIQFSVQDIRSQVPEKTFDLILCRNLVFTYFEEDMQRRIFKAICNRLDSNGFLIIGSHESVPPRETRLFNYKGYRSILSINKMEGKDSNESNI